MNDPPNYVGGFEREDIRALLNMMEHNDLGWAEYLAPLVMKNPDRPSLVND